MKTVMRCCTLLRALVILAITRSKNSRPACKFATVVVTSMSKAAPSACSCRDNINLPPKCAHTASKLMNAAKKDFKDVEHSEDLTEAGAKFANSVERGFN